MSGRGIFVSCRRDDREVAPINTADPSEGLFASQPIDTTRVFAVGDYADQLERCLGASGRVREDEPRDEDLGSLTEDEIWEKLKGGISGSALTIVLISKGMKDPTRSEASQWIPWEISFSLRETARDDGTSRSNALLAVILPETDFSYDYIFRKNVIGGPPILLLDSLFAIIKGNMFNRSHYPVPPFYDKNRSKASYISPVLWEDFISSSSHYIDLAAEIQNHAGSYLITTAI
jgi:hypothetical protein